MPASPARKARLLSSMEILGFYDTPYGYTTPPRSPGTVATPPPPVVDNPLGNWEPHSVDHRRTLGPSVRWSLVMLILVGLGLGATGALLAVRGPAMVRERAFGQVSDRATALRLELEALSLEGLASDPEAWDPTTVTTRLAEIERRARELFQAGSELPDTEAAIRSLTATAAGEALEGTRTLEGVLAFRLAVEPLLRPPALVTDPTLIELDQAVEDFTLWRVRFEQLVEALPRGVLDDVAADMTALSDRLEGVQTAYLDALRIGDESQARAAVGGLEDQMAAIRTLLDGDVEQAVAQAAAAFDTAQAALELLVG